MNLLMISFEFPPEPGGIGNYAYHTSKQLVRLGHSVTAVVSYKNLNQNEFMDFAKNQTFRIYNFSKYNYRFHTILLAFNYFRKIIKDNRIELIIIAYHKAGIIGWLFKTIFGIPYFIIGHGSEFLPLNFWHDIMIKLIFQGSDVIIPNSNFTEKLLKNAKIKHDKVIIIHPGADDERYIYEGKRYLDKSKVIILTVGALSLRKGHRYVIDTINILKEKFPAIEYWIIGKGSEKKNLETYTIKYDLDKNVKIIGFVPTEMLPEYYKQADIFILNSINDDPTQVEGFGIVLIEANLMKLPVIASRQSGMEDAVEDGVSGVLVDPKDVQQIAKTVESLIADNEMYLQLSEDGYSRAKSIFTWKITAKKLDKIIREYE